MELTSIKSLPHEIIGKIADNLDVKDIVNFSRTNVGVNRAIQHQLKSAAFGHAFAPEDYYANAIIFRSGQAVLDENMAFEAPREPMVKAIKEDNVDAVKGFLDAGVRVDEYSIHGERLLYTAVKYRAYNVTQLLLDRNTSPNLYNLASQNAPLVAAAAINDEHLIKALIKEGADINAPNTVATILQNCSLGMLRFALQNNAILAEVDEGDIRFPVPGIPPFHHAAVNKSHPDVLRFLLRYIPEQLNYLDDQFGRNALWVAVRERNTNAIIDLLAAGININQRDIFGENVMHYYLQYFADTNIPFRLFEYGIDVGLPGRNGMTELHYAAELGAEGVVQMLIEEEVFVDAQDAQGRTALHWAVRGNHDRVVRLLVEEGWAFLNITDVWNNTPMDIAHNKEYREIWTYLSLKTQELTMPS